MNHIVKKAIEEMRLLEIRYDGGGRRIIEPHCLGIKRDGSLAVRAFQTGGDSSTGGIPAWRLFELDKANNIKILGQKFSRPRPGYVQGDSAMIQIFIEI